MSPVEIRLTLVVGAVELRAARRPSRLPPPAFGGGKHLVFLVSAEDERTSVWKIWKRSGDALAADVL
ncbi:hypothetical protein [Streptomyces seoulensis]|uniref:hypothetical protein n=1 Tax=Streptomyces seoulensis TaxID=73044 RepID=UPI00103A68D7|nr:hypothetical protein [Streptomyces seoulensis]